MFTGIIAAVGTIDGIKEKGGDKRLSVAAGKLDLGDVSIGDSISVNGVCLTVTSKQDGRFAVDVSRETLSCTTLADIAGGGQPGKGHAAG